MTLWLIKYRWIELLLEVLDSNVCRGKKHVSCSTGPIQVLHQVLHVNKHSTNRQAGTDGAARAVPISSTEVSCR